jgi:hypothetical protein
MKTKEEIYHEKLNFVLEGIDFDSFNEVLVEDSEEGKMMRATMDAMEEYANQDKWISVEDELPKSDEPIKFMILINGWKLEFAYFNQVTQHFMGFINVTHWQNKPTLPTPPTK